MKTIDILLRDYGIDLDTKDLAKYMGWAQKSVQNAIAADNFPIKTFKRRGKHYADIRDVADYHDKIRKSA